MNIPIVHASLLNHSINNARGDPPIDGLSTSSIVDPRTPAASLREPHNVVTAYVDEPTHELVGFLDSIGMHDAYTPANDLGYFDESFFDNHDVP